MDRQLRERWRKCETILESYLQEDRCFLTLEEAKNALISSKLATNKESLNNVLSALNMQPSRRCTVYDVERAALLLTSKPQQEEIFEILVETLDPESTGIIHINQLRLLLRKFGASMTDVKWNHLRDTYAPGSDDVFTHEQLRSILRACEDSKNHEPGSD